MTGAIVGNGNIIGLVNFARNSGTSALVVLFRKGWIK
jgi:hypothetical protein